MAGQPTVLAICTANVCRSVLAASLIRSTLDDLGIRVHSAGIAATGGQAPCSLVVERVSGIHDLSLSHTSSQLTMDDLQGASLILTMTTAQRGEVNRLWRGARGLAFTLIEAATIADSLNEPMELDQLVATLSDQRSRVPMPSAPRALFPWLSRPDPEPRISIPDGHLGRGRSDHVDTLDQVEREASRLATALRRLVNPSPKPGQHPAPDRTHPIP